MNILECTIKMKNETRTHYERLAESVTDDELKRLFRLLAAAEDEHIQKLAALQNDMNKRKVKDLNRLEESVCVYSPHIDPRHLAEALSHDPDAYRHVVQEEEETIEFFDQLSNQADSEELKRICRLQAAKEREHLTMLENIYFFVEEPRTYLEWGEFSNLKSL
jgi:rubrerythrin